MNKRLTVFCVLFALVYTVGIVSSLREYIVAFKAGFEIGVSNFEAGNTIDIYAFEVKPVNGLLSCPTTIKNEKTGQTIQAQASDFKVLLTYPKNSAPKSSAIYGWILFISNFLLMFILVYIPVQAFKIIKSVMKEMIFNRRNILRLMNIGFSVICLFICKNLSLLMYNLKASQALEIAGYKIAINNHESVLLIFGISICIFSEILRHATEIKEEQDLTV